jgi:hypothetical protein
MAERQVHGRSSRYGGAGAHLRATWPTAFIGRKRTVGGEARERNPLSSTGIAAATARQAARPPAERERSLAARSAAQRSHHGKHADVGVVADERGADPSPDGAGADPRPSARRPPTAPSRPGRLR